MDSSSSLPPAPVPHNSQALGTISVSRILEALGKWEDPSSDVREYILSQSRETDDFLHFEDLLIARACITKSIPESILEYVSKDHPRAREYFIQVEL